MNEDLPSIDVLDSFFPRSSSASSSFDPYYFGLQSPSVSPIPPLPPLPETPRRSPLADPITPARHPASIDRRALVGVGDLTTPRWSQHDRREEDNEDNEAFEIVASESADPDEPDSPWTIEAVDGELSEQEELSELQPMKRPFRYKTSVAEESGGEEILYPRKFSAPVKDSAVFHRTAHTTEHTPRASNTAHGSRSDHGQLSSPPSSYALARKTRKRSSEEFELDQFGVLVTKQPYTESSAKDSDMLSGRKHNSLNFTAAAANVNSRDSKGKERRRGSTGLTLTTSAKATSVARHASQVSAGPAVAAIKEMPTESYLPTSGSAVKVSSPSHVTVAHSVLRGPQEGWSELDDEATAAALRKLDGLSGKTARARASIASLSNAARPSSSSRPPTPVGKAGQREGINPVDAARSRRNTKEGNPNRDSLAGSGMSKSNATDHSVNVTSSDEQQPASFPMLDKAFKTASTSARTSFTPKRGSTSSTNYTSTPTTSSRDSTSVSVSTSLTSVSAISGRYSTSKVRRDSTGSESMHLSDGHSTKERNSVSINDHVDDSSVPPVPPLPKDLANYRSSQPNLSLSLTCDDVSVHPAVEGRQAPEAVSDAPPLQSRQITITSPFSGRQRQRPVSGHTSLPSTATLEASSSMPKTPSKKWSFSALSLKLPGTPSTSAPKSTFPLSPRSITFGSRPKSSIKDQTAGQRDPWSTEQPGAMGSEGSLLSLSSTGLTQNSTAQMHLPRTPDATVAPSRSSTASSASIHHVTSALVVPQSDPLSPSSSMRRGQSRRLTPSSIPFFRRSSSQSIHVPPQTMMSSSPTFLGGTQTPSSRRPNTSSSKDHHQAVPSTPASAQKKSSVLSLGFPSLLKSTSRRSLHSDSKDSTKDSQKAKEEKTKTGKDKHKKDEKDRSESRISLLMGGGRRRGKTLSSAEPRKARSPVNLPPIQVPALEQSTAQRVAKLKPNSSVSTVMPLSPRSISTSRVTSQTVSSMQKQSDVSLRNRNQLPTIAGSPSVIGASKEARELVQSTSKETPTKIPRISSRTSTAASPTMKPPPSTTRRINAHTGGLSLSANPSPTALSANEFGVMDSGDDMGSKSSLLKQSSLRISPSSFSRLPKQSTSMSLSSNLSMKKNRDSVSFLGVRKPSTSSIASLSTPAAPAESTSRHFSALSPSKGLKLLSPKISLSSTRGSNAASVANVRQGSPSSNRRTPSTPSPAPSSVDEDEMMGDEEMMQYIRRQHAKRLAAGATQEELDKLLQFPEPIPPSTPTSPTAILQSTKAIFLSDYERKEIVDYPSVYCTGENSRKNLAVLSNSTNNYGYDDDRGDYLVINRDHLAYRYEIMDTLGKGSFGQVLHCRDHVTGESVAIKIIRNKKRFHHQALVEIRILDKLRIWDADEKHHVIKMNEHFYFRNHLCIAMELLSINLYELIKANGFIGFTTALIRRFTNQMLMSLSLMRQYRIVHCDLKPENVLLRHPSKSAIKVIDFGSSCFENEKIYTYIQSRFYRSPEVILGMNYHMAIDMWSLGCILAELYTGFPIFPGENEQEQLSCIMEVLGVPDKEFINRSSRKKLFFEANGTPRVVVNSKGRRRRPGSKTLQQVLKCNDEEFVDFISKCLVWDPERRMKPQTALRHQFVTVGRRPRPPAAAIVPKSSPSLNSNSSRGKHVVETPKKSIISAPTPLTARSSRTAGGPTTPSSSSHVSTLSSSSKSYRSSSHSHGLSAYHSGRTLSGVTTTATK
ncbi:hypothetical protein JOM56_003749 [Amanita muscaria]